MFPRLKKINLKLVILQGITLKRTIKIVRGSNNLKILSISVLLVEGCDAANTDLLNMIKKLKLQDVVVLKVL